MALEGFFPTSLCRGWNSNPHQQSCTDVGPFEGCSTLYWLSYRWHILIGMSLFDSFPIFPMIYTIQNSVEMSFFTEIDWHRSPKKTRSKNYRTWWWPFHFNAVSNSSETKSLNFLRVDSHSNLLLHDKSPCFRQHLWWQFALKG